MLGKATQDGAENLVTSSSPEVAVDDLDLDRPPITRCFDRRSNPAQLDDAVSHQTAPGKQLS